MLSASLSYFHIYVRELPVHRFSIAFAISMAFASCVWADTPHEAAAKQIFKITFAVDKPRMVQAFSASMGVGLSAIDREAFVEALESNEVEAIFIKNYMKAFSEPELIALAEMMGTPAYRVYVERMPVFIQSAMPEVAAYGRKALPEFRQRAIERAKAAGK